MFLAAAALCQRSLASREHRVVLPDGSYDALVVDARADDDGTLHLEVALTTGPMKGEVVRIAGRCGGVSELDILAAPATLVVEGGTPRLRLDA